MWDMEDIFIEKQSKNVYFVKLRKEVYEKKAVMMTVDMFTDQCFVKIDEIDGDTDFVGVWFKLKYEINPPKVQQLLNQFCNEVLDKQIQIDLEDRFGNLREMIYERAFRPVEARSL